MYERLHVRRGMASWVVEPFHQISMPEVRHNRPSIPRVADQLAPGSATGWPFGHSSGAVCTTLPSFLPAKRLAGAVHGQTVEPGSDIDSAGGMPSRQKRRRCRRNRDGKFSLVRSPVAGWQPAALMA